MLLAIIIQFCIGFIVGKIYIPVRIGSCINSSFPVAGIVLTYSS
jgi:hypothetical protein